MKKRIVQVIIASIVGIILAGFIVAYQIQQEKNADLTAFDLRKKAPSIVAKNFGGAFTLIDQDGETVTDKDFDNQYRLIYFGFTYCPAICPTELQKIAQALKLSGDKGEKILPIFITVDPERDDVATMKQYVELFHPRLIGLTGSSEQINKAKDAYKIYSTKVKTEEMSDYTVDHSSYIYFMDPDDNLLQIFKVDNSAQSIAETIEQIL